MVNYRKKYLDGFVPKAGDVGSRGELTSEQKTPAQASPALELAIEDILDRICIGVTKGSTTYELRYVEEATQSITSLIQRQVLKGRIEGGKAFWKYLSNEMRDSGRIKFDTTEIYETYERFMEALKEEVAE